MQACRPRRPSRPPPPNMSSSLVSCALRSATLVRILRRVSSARLAPLLGLAIQGVIGC